jgi:hypothetical protein
MSGFIDVRIWNGRPVIKTGYPVAFIDVRLWNGHQATFYI